MAAGLRSGPDFMCIGLQKAGTGWLYDQLDSHPDFEMPPVKELHYFDKALEAPGLTELNKRVQLNLGKLNAWRERQHKHHLAQADLAFIDRAVQRQRQPASADVYATLFEYQGLTGDVTPAYSTLPNETIAQIASRLPQLKIVLLLREPASRAVSHLSMMIDLGKMPPETSESVSRASGWFSRPEVQDRSRPSVTWRRWAAHFPPEQMRFFFFEDLCERPDWLIGRIIKFLGADPWKRITLPADYNRKGALRTAVSAKVRGYFADALEGEVAACAKLFGGHAAEWPTRARLEASAA